MAKPTPSAAIPSASSNSAADGPVERLGRFLTRWADWAMGIGLLGLMVTLLVPLPAPVLDVLLAFNISISH